VRGNELLDLMELVDPAYVAAADMIPKKKNRTVWKTVAAIFCVVLCGGLISYIFPFLSPGNPPDVPYPVTGMNSPWEHEGNSITVTDVTVTDSYLAQDGTLYSEEKGDYLVIVRCKAILVPGWSITGHSLTCSGSSGTNLCSPSEPLIEVSENGEKTRLLLFSIRMQDFAGDIDAYLLEIQIGSGNRVGQQGFVFFQKTASTLLGLVV